eukprot:CAMPEP_0170478228 /NCGR_PEP_ID=MMETSP0123-20130129/19311_1 /TAXON_ID=182087 /ORGANISM="Favella ehrenbergii, Strain Fehren 1" /LENGTH=71 /DNA_ID=CAMNT_0010750393 /DNA_START=128 /DNA_END=343 /DNA_ORIENTATION=-
MVAEKRTELDDVCNMFISGADTNGNGVLDKEEARAWAVENGKEAKVEPSSSILTRTTTTRGRAQGFLQQGL